MTDATENAKVVWADVTDYMRVYLVYSMRGKREHIVSRFKIIADLSLEGIGGGTVTLLPGSEVCIGGAASAVVSALGDGNVGLALSIATTQTEMHIYKRARACLRCARFSSKHRHCVLCGTCVCEKCYSGEGLMCAVCDKLYAMTKIYADRARGVLREDSVVPVRFSLLGVTWAPTRTYTRRLGHHERAIMSPDGSCRRDGRGEYRSRTNIDLDGGLDHELTKDRAIMYCSRVGGFVSPLLAYCDFAKAAQLTLL